MKSKASTLSSGGRSTVINAHSTSQVAEQLEGKVDALLGSVIAAAAAGGGGEGQVAPLAARFAALVAASAAGEAPAAAIDAFCEGCVHAHSVREASARLTKLLVDYATTRLSAQQATASH